MDKTFFIIILIVLAAALVYIGYMHGDKGSVQGPTQTITHVHNYYDSSSKRPTVVSPVVIVNSQSVAVPQKVDTAAILSAYFAINTSTQTISDTSIRIQITDTITENKIRGRSLSYQWLRPQKTIDSIFVPAQIRDNRGFFAGAFAYSAGNGNANAAAGPMAGYLFPRQIYLSAGYDVLNRGFLLQAQFKLHVTGKH